MINCQHSFNDDKSPLIDLLNCIVCSQTMKIEKSSPDADCMEVWTSFNIGGALRQN